MKHLLIGLFAWASMTAHAITVDGNLADWGINPTTYQPAAGIHYTVEDWTGAPANGYLNPGYGGQAYDAEALYVKFENGFFYLALITGHHPQTLQNPSANSFGAGDFAFDFGRNGTFDLGINVNHRTGAASYESLVQGGIYTNPTWSYGLWASNGSYNPSNPDPIHPTSIASGTLIGTAALAFTTSATTGYGNNPTHAHYFYEVGLPINFLLQGGWDGLSSFGVHWTMLCANDAIEITTPRVVPEPATGTLLTFAFVGMIAAARALRHRRLRREIVQGPPA